MNHHGRSSGARALSYRPPEVGRTAKALRRRQHLRRRARRGPCGGGRRGSRDPRACSCEAGSRGSWHDAGCSAGKSACSRVTPRRLGSTTSHGQETVTRLCLGTDSARRPYPHRGHGEGAEWLDNATSRPGLWSNQHYHAAAGVRRIATRTRPRASSLRAPTSCEGPIPTLWKSAHRGKPAGHFGRSSRNRPDHRESRDRAARVSWRRDRTSLVG